MLLLLLVACAEPPPAKPPAPPPEAPDADGDGATDAVDCAPEDPYVAPGTPEIPYDGTDQDCDGADVIDYDGDGYVGDSVGGDDCNDNNPNVNPAATEICYNLLDDDCVGDDGDSTDCDDDGYDRAVDCEDEDPTINPGAEDVPYDGEDTDCDGRADDDIDGDGHPGEPAGGDDCNDENASIFPRAPEIWDHEDSDCDGDIDVLDPDGATAVWRADFANGEAQAGYAIVPMGDLDGDGDPEVAFSAPGTDTDAGRVWLVEVNAGINTASANYEAWIQGGAGEYLGFGLAHVGAHLVVMGSTGALLYETAELNGRVVLGSDDAVGSISTPGALPLLSAGPLVDSILMGNAGPCPNACFLGLFTAAAAAQDIADARLLVRGTAEDVASSFESPGDLDGDGISDLIAGFLGSGDLEAEATSTVSLLSADEAGDLRRDDLLNLSVFGPVTTFGADLDGDGTVDLLIADALDPRGAEGAGALYVLPANGWLAGGSLADQASASWAPAATDSRLEVVGTGDLDGDTLAEILVCSPGSTETDAAALIGGCVALSPGTGSLTAQTWPVWDGDLNGTLFGQTAVLDDTDDDGDLDLWVGAPAEYGDVFWFRQE